MLGEHGVEPRAGLRTIHAIDGAIVVTAILERLLNGSDLLGAERLEIHDLHVSTKDALHLGWIDALPSRGGAGARAALQGRLRSAHGSARAHASGATRRCAAAAVCALRATALRALGSTPL